jgi:hypothetical protein
MAQAGSQRPHKTRHRRFFHLSRRPAACFAAGMLGSIDAEDCQRLGAMAVI